MSTANVEAADRLDDAIEALLRDDEHGSDGTDRQLIDIARLLRDALPRFHPRFGFEELLSGRLSAAARVGSAPAGVVSLDRARRPHPTGPGKAAEGGHRRRRSLVAGGAIASGVSIAIPLAGAAIVMWRRGRHTDGWL